MQPVARPGGLLLGLYVASAALVTVQQAILGPSNNLSIFRSASRRLRLDDVDGATGLDGAGHGLASTRGPANVDRGGVGGVCETEIERQAALREAYRPSRAHLQPPAPVRGHDRRLDRLPLAAPRRAAEPDHPDVDLKVVGHIP